MEKEASPVGIPHPPPPPPPFLVPPQTTTCRGLDSGVGRPGVCRLSPVLRSRLHRGHLKTPGLPWTVVDLAYGGGGGGWVGISSLEDRSTELVDLASPGHFVSRRPVLPGMASLLLALNLVPWIPSSDVGNHLPCSPDTDTNGGGCGVWVGEERAQSGKLLSPLFVAASRWTKQ